MRLLVLSCCCLFLTACGHSEEEMQAAIASARMQCTTDATSASAPTHDATHVGCEKDTDCKGDRVCDLGRCTTPAP